jgi:hypothetical protein
VKPDQTVARGGLGCGRGDRGAIDEDPLVIELVVDRSPRDAAATDRGARGDVRGASPGQDGEGSAAVLGDGGQVLGGGGLAVGDVEEVGAAGETAEEVPGVAVRAVVGGVAALDPEPDGDGAVAGHREEIKEWFEVGSVVLVVTPGDGGSGPAAAGRLVRGGVVIAVEGDGGGVVVESVEFDVEFAAGVGGDVEGERGDVGIEKPVEGATDAVVVERVESSFGRGERRRLVPGGPAADAVEGLAGEEDVADRE